MAHGLSCPGVSGILALQPGIKPMSPALEGRFLTTRPPGKSPKYTLLVPFLMVFPKGLSLTLFSSHLLHLPWMSSSAFEIYAADSHMSASHASFFPSCCSQAHRCPTGTPGSPRGRDGVTWAFWLRYQGISSPVLLT